MEGDRQELHTFIFKLLDELLTEVHHGCRCGNGPPVGCKNGLVPILVLFNRFPFNVGRQGHLADLIQDPVELVVGSVKQKTDGSTPGGGVVHNLGHQFIPEIELVTDPDLSRRLYQNIPQHVLRLKLSEQKYLDRKSTRLNSSHVAISYAVFCLKK